MANETSYTSKGIIRAPFLTIFEPRQFNGKGDPKFSATFLFPIDSPEINVLKAQIKAAANTKWPGRAMSELKLPIATGESKAAKAQAKGKDGSFYVGNIVLTARSKYPPVLSVLQGGKIISLDSDTLKAQYKAKFYNGCHVGFSVNFVPYVSDMGADGVTAYLQSILWLKDGERIGGRDQAEVFKEYAGHVTDEDPLGDDEMPF